MIDDLVYCFFFFFIETQGCIALPKGERGEMELFAGSQGIRIVQEVVSHALNVPSSRIHCRVKRLGGGFGGKDTRNAHISGVTAVAAHKLKRPIRFILNREDDMVMTGKRHEFLGQWKVGVTKEGKITAYQLRVSNAITSGILNLYYYYYHHYYGIGLSEWWL
jgi:xanthine dehydrogenase/oxidase